MLIKMAKTKKGLPVVELSTLMESTNQKRTPSEIFKQMKEENPVLANHIEGGLGSSRPNVVLYGATKLYDLLRIQAEKDIFRGE